ncbi:MAG: NAD-binding protein, partial [Pseudonocardia sp.]|nr:NAD-binding protein [Pseudonocardia sp.]
MPSVAVVGGSLGGLTAALVLTDVGCDVTVLERSTATLEARGAGIAVLDDTVRWFAEKTDLDPDGLCSSTGFIRFLDANGRLVHERAHRYRFSSWNTIYRALLAQLPSERYRLGQDVVALAPIGGAVELQLGSGKRRRADLAVAADGINSPTRARLLPEVAPRYSGYVAWRGTMPESELGPATFAALSDAITYQVLPGGHILVYPIPGPSGSVVVGQRLMNFVWYRNIAEGAELEELMTDRDGRLRQVSLPPGAAR